MTPAVADATAESNVLLLAPEFRDGDGAVCGSLLEPAAAERTRTVVVTCGRAPADRLAALDDHVDVAAQELIVLEVTGCPPSSGDGATDGGRVAPPDVTRHETIPEPTDLIDLGTTVDGLLSDPSSDALRRALCLHSLTALIQHGNTRDVFMFLEVLTDAVERAGAVAHYHMDPTAHDPETVLTFEQLFDRTVDTRE